MLQITVWKEPDLSTEVAVLADGSISFPLIGAVEAEDRTTLDLEDELATELARFIEAPVVSVVVKESRSRRVYVMGKVNAPGQFPLMPGMTVIQALAAAQGLQEWADAGGILVVRSEKGRVEQIPFDYDEFLGGDVGQNVVLKPNDTVVVP